MARRRLQQVTFSQLGALPFARLKRALTGDVPGVSLEWAAEGLRRSSKGLTLLIETIDSSAPVNVRRAAVYGPMSETSARSYKILLRVFSDEAEDPSVRAQAAEGLAGRVVFDARVRRRRIDVDAQAALLRGLDDASPAVRFWSAFALAKPGNVGALQKLSRLKRDRTLIPGWWTIGQEATWAVSVIRGEDEGREPREF